MNGYDILRKVRQMVMRRCAEIEGEKILYPSRIDDLRLESADMDTILDALEDIDQGNKDRTDLQSKGTFDFIGQANAAMDELLRKI